MNASADTPSLPLAQYRARFHLPTDAGLPDYLGSTVRGAFGHALKEAVCVTHLPKCTQCLMQQSCAYAYLFETPPPPDTSKMRLYPAAPHPFVFEVPAPEAAPVRDTALDIGFTLFGEGNRYLAHMIHALTAAGQRGLGKHRVQLALEDVMQRSDPQAENWATIYRPGIGLSPQPPMHPAVPPMPSSADIQFETPLRLRRDNRNIGAHDLRFADLFINVMRRLAMLSYFHTDQPHETDFAMLAAHAREVPLAARDLRWHDWTRYSSRQQTRMNMGGLLGRITVRFEGLEALWPNVWLGQWTHAGKGTSMGLGRYRLASLRFD